MYLSRTATPTNTLHKPSMLATVLLHALVLGVLWWGAKWAAPQPTEVELWDAGSLGGANSSANAAQNTAVDATPVENVAPTPPMPIPEQSVTQAPTQPSITQPNVTPPPAQVQPDIAAPNSKPQPQKPTVPNNAAANKPQTTPNNAAQKPNTAARNDVLAQIRQGSATGAGSGTGSGSAAGRGNANYEEYKAKVESMIEARGRNQGLSGTTGRVSFRVAPNGSISNVSVSGMPPDKAETLKRVISGLVLPRENGAIPPPALSGGMNFNVRI